MWGNRGYVGQRMSVRAVASYEAGEMPYSKWSKENLLDRIEEIITENELKPDYDKSTLEKAPLPVLRSLFLEFASWHHTGKYYSETDFYQVSEERVSRISTAIIQNAIKEHREEVRINAETKKQEKEQAKSEWYFASVDYEEWGGTRRHPKLYNETMQGIAYKGWIHDIYGGKKNLSGKHILSVNNLGQRIPKSWDANRCKELKKQLGLKMHRKPASLKHNENVLTLAQIEELSTIKEPQISKATGKER